MEGYYGNYRQGKNLQVGEKRNLRNWWVLQNSGCCGFGRIVGEKKLLAIPVDFKRGRV